MKAFKAECAYRAHKDGQTPGVLLAEPWDDELAPDGIHVSAIGETSVLLCRRDVRRLHAALGRWLAPKKPKAKRGTRS